MSFQPLWEQTWNAPKQRQKLPLNVEHFIGKTIMTDHVLMPARRRSDNLIIRMEAGNVSTIWTTRTIKKPQSIWLVIKTFFATKYLWYLLFLFHENSCVRWSNRLIVRYWEDIFMCSTLSERWYFGMDMSSKCCCDYYVFNYLCFASCFYCIMPTPHVDLTQKTSEFFI